MLENFTDLDADLAVGSHPHAPDQIQRLRSAGCRAVVNLQSDDDLRSRGLDWPILWQLYLREGITPTRVPILDFEPVDLARHLDAAVAAVAEHVAAGRKTYVHCNAGMNRSPSVVIAYVARHRDLTLRQATLWLTDRHVAMPYPEVLEGWARRHGVSLE
jgi:protein-tyrosine phosphatase